MRFGVHLAASGPQGTADRIGRLAARAEALGLESVFVSDHIVMPTEFGSAYPYGPPGTFSVESSRNYFEPIVTLAWVAGATRRVRLGISVLVVPLRNPVLAAKQLATLDALSGGRLIIGIGVGWLVEEFEALGNQHFRRRGSLSDEYLEIFRALWSGEPTAFDGRFYSFRTVQAQPTPLQRPSPPIWVGGHGERALRRTVELGDAWHAIRIGVDDFKRGAERLGELAAERGRARPALTTRCSFGPAGSGRVTAEHELFGGPAATAGVLDRYAAAGCEEVVLDLFPRDSTEAMLEALEHFAADVKPLLTAAS